MQKNRNKNSKKSTPSNPALALVIGVLIVVAGLFLVNLITGYVEKKAFFSLKADLIELQTQFNEIDKGWKYDESCRAKGGVYENDIASSCAASITNSSVDFTVDQKKRVEAYSGIIDDGSSFKLKDSITEYSQSYYFVTYDYPKLQKPNCSLQSFTDKETVDGKVSLTFGCIAESSKFYFERND
jgi:hypothetical protein